MKIKHTEYKKLYPDVADYWHIVTIERQKANKTGVLIPWPAKDIVSRNINETIKYYNPNNIYTVY